MTQSAVRIISLALALAASSMTLADPTEVTRSRVVRFADLDLNSRDGALAAYICLSRAADALCELSWHMRSLDAAATMSGEVQRCKSEAIENAVKQIHAPALTAYYVEQSQGKLTPVSVAQRR